MRPFAGHGNAYSLPFSLATPKPYDAKNMRDIALKWLDRSDALQWSGTELSIGELYLVLGWVTREDIRLCGECQLIYE